MDELAGILKVILKRVPYEPFLRNELDCMAVRKEMLNKILHHYMPYNSDTEVQYKIESLADDLEKYVMLFGNGQHTGRREVSVFDAVFFFSEQMLVSQNNEVMCRYEKILRWRVTTIDISEEIFVTAFLAKRDTDAGIRRRYFAWPVVIGHNNVQLRKITQKGMAENHFHLWGSAPYFQVSWIRLMNEIGNPDYLEKLDRFEDNLRTGYIMFDRKYPENGIRRSCMQAALIRLFLYARLTGTMIELGEYYTDWTCLLPWISKLEGSISRSELDKIRQTCRFLPTYDFLYKLSDHCRELEKYCDSLGMILDAGPDYEEKKLSGPVIAIRDIVGSMLRRKGRIRLMDIRELISAEMFSELWWDGTFQNTVFLLNHQDALDRHADRIRDIIAGLVPYFDGPEDYALSAIGFKKYSGQEIYRILSGERWLMYEMFRKALRRDRELSPQVYNMFYAYLVIRERIRGEFVQSNNWVGFENFQIYQARKSLFSDGDGYERLMARMAVLSCFQENVESLEIRISPLAAAEQDYELISFLDHSIDPEQKTGKKFFYVFHFIKKPDDRIDGNVYCECRHSSLRKEIRKKAQALLEFRRNCPRTAARVLGIDAAGQEIGCRPEVFAQTFRTLQNDISSLYVGSEVKRLPQLRVTYHAGEEFLDVTDGLRAIDEAVLFLNMSCGNRIGHALALGICVREWYEFKRYRISLKMQDHLDNLVWLYHAIVRYGIYCLDNLKDRIEDEFQKYFFEIYGKYMKKEFIRKIQKASRNTGHLNFDIHAYYNAWKLRGDDPGLYSRGYFKRQYCFSPFDVYAVNRIYPSDFDLRYKPEPAMINYYYHYNADVRRAGNREIDIKVTEDYIKGVELVQKAMQKEIAARGIAIETNPSSNYLIGTFRRYDKHPITRFYNNGLTCDEKQLAESPQIWTSINTDDQGVFGVTLENEYALLARALEKKKDRGEPVYQKAMIYDWLDKIREMGISQSFYDNEYDFRRGK